MRPARPLETREGYDRWSAIYDGDGNPLIAVEQPVFAELVGDVSGLRVADIGCGTGRHAITLAESGARVTALDFSTGMLARAREKDEARRVEWVEHDLRTSLPLEAGMFDLVVCALVLDHIEDLSRFFGELGRVCAPGGAVVCTVMHPAMMLKGVQARFDDPSTGEKVRVRSASNMVSDYFAGIVGGGLQVDHMSEHVVEAGLAERLPRAEPYVDWPILLAMRLRAPKENG